MQPGLRGAGPQLSPQDPGTHTHPLLDSLHFEIAEIV